MKAVCPNNPRHEQFMTVAHVTEDWIVDPEGNFIEVAAGSEIYVVHGPTVGNSWQCVICEEEAKVTG